ncbi:hypothetical protein [Rhodococcus opacus]|uniref:hypothetical protein n=1 Tax=Rhodococcus opacus TaxID=37919 RepID=UPI0005C1EC00|nr:hypothetical protein [Rhodococcus opacus]
MSRRDDGTDGPDLPDVPLEYEVSFDTWGLRCANSLLRGLISGQRRGGIAVSSFSVLPDDDTIEVIIDYYMNSRELRARVGYRFVISALRSIARDDDAVSAAGMYVDDLFLLPASLPGDPVNGVHWITRPGFV